MDTPGDPTTTMVFQLPVVVTAAETVVVGQQNDKDEEGQMLPIPSNKAPNATIAAGDDEICNCSNNYDSTEHKNYGGNITSEDTATPDHDLKQKRMLPCLMQSFMELLLSFSFSIVLKLLFGGLCGIRTLVLVHSFNFLLSCLSTTEQMAGRWLPPILQFNTALAVSGGVTLSTIDKGFSSSRISWPPPTLVALGIFTIGTFIVHPDGYTWIVIHKIRDATYFVMQSSTTCWAIAVNDYGSIVSTMLAMSTFAALFFFVYMLHCTLKSRTVMNRQHQQNHKNSEKHKRKKRKHGTVRSNQKYTGRIRAANEIDQDIVAQNNDPKDENTSLYPNDTIQNDNVVQHILPPLAEDEPLDSPPPSGASFSETLVTLSKFESPQSHFVSSRLRTASSSTADSAACSLDDQSSCSGRSTPTPISVNESVHLPFVTTPVKQSPAYSNSPAVRGKNGGMNVTNTPNQSLNQNLRRNQTNRRSGKKTGSQSSEVPTAVVTNKSPPLTPSKRWDALKPANRTSATRQQQQQRQPFSRKSESTEVIHSSVAPRTLSDDRQPPANDIDNQFKAQTTTVVATNKPHGLECSIPLTAYTQGGVYSASPNVVRDDANYVYDESIMNDRIQFSRLNPNCNSWTGTLNVVPKVETYSSDPPSSDSFHGNGVLGFDVPRFESHSTSSTIEYFDKPQPHPCYTYDREGLNSNDEQSLQSGLSVPSFDLSFLHNIPGSNNDSVEHCDSRYATRFPAPTSSLSSSPLYIDPTLMMISSNTTAPNASAPMNSPFVHNYQYYHSTHVRENPFATSDDDDDDDQIEAKLLELGGQMVGSILDY